MTPVGRLGEPMTKLFKIRFRPGEEISARLEAIDRDPTRIDLIINSHFHFDHVGGNALIPNATMIVQRREWDARTDPDIAVPHGFNPRDFDLGHKLRLMYSVMGRSYASQRTVIRQDTSRCACGSTAARSCSPGMPAISARPCVSDGSHGMCSTARQCWHRSIS
jgi:ribonuclease BN (tRNA processing enzyme)